MSETIDPPSSPRTPRRALQLIRVAAAKAYALVRFAAVRVPYLLLPLVLVYAIESLSRVSAVDAFEWLRDSPNEAQLNYLLALGLTLLAAAIVGRTRAAYAVLTLLCVAIAFISGTKTNTTGAPLFLWNIVLPNDTHDAAAPMNAPLTFGLSAIGVVTLIAVFLPLVAIRRLGVKLAAVERTVLGALAVFLLFSVYADVPIAFKANANIFTIGWDQVRNYKRNGYLLSTAMGVDLVRIDKPGGTNGAAIQRLVRKIEAESGDGGYAGHAGNGGNMGNGDSMGHAGNADNTGNVGKDGNAGITRNTGGITGGQATAANPNIIVILSESFWDPTLIRSAAFSEDPMPHFRALMQRYTSGWMLSPQFGGGTANVEFEVLSGHSMRFLPADAIAYIEYMNRGVDSLAAIMARQGYTSTAFNPFFNWFFNSRNVYKNFGFARFVSSEFMDPIYHGPNLADDQVMKRVAEATGRTPGPDFVFANTMENHGPYNDKFGVHPIRVTGAFSAEAIDMLENYAAGVHAFDEAFQGLIDHYAGSGEPTIVLCFGDHLPTLGDNYKVYKETGYLTGDNDPDKLAKLFSTPFVVWSNYLSGPRETLRMSPAFLGPYVLHLAGKKGTYYTDYLYRLSQRIPVIPPRRYYASMGIDDRDLGDYKRLQYDILFGSQYGYREMGIGGRIVNPAFALGDGQPHVDEAKIVEEGKLEISGDAFTSACSVWLGGKKLDTSWRDAHHLSATLPAGAVKDGADETVEVRLVDDKNTIIAKSNVYSMRIGK